MNITVTNTGASVHVTFAGPENLSLFTSNNSTTLCLTLKPSEARKLVDAMAAAGHAASSVVLPNDAAADLAAIKAKLGVGQ